MNIIICNVGVINCHNIWSSCLCIGVAVFLTHLFMCIGVSSMIDETPIKIALLSKEDPTRFTRFPLRLDNQRS